MKSILARFNLGMYKKIKDYADENGITVIGSIRFIINQFFKDKK